MDENDAITRPLYRTLTLTKERLAVMQQISKAVLTTARLVVEEMPFIAGLSESLLLRLDAYVWKAIDHKKLAARYPETWWDAFKLRWFPVWMLQRWPVKYVEVWSETSILYPDLILPNQRHVKHHTFIREEGYDPDD